MVSDSYAVASHRRDNPYELCTLEYCKYHVLLYGSPISSVWEKLKLHKFRYQLADDVYAYYKFFVMHEQYIDRRGYIMDELTQALRYNRCMPNAEHRPSIWRKRIARKVYKSHNISTKDTSVQTHAEYF